MSVQTWKIDSTHSSVNFAVRHMMVSKVRGRFEKWSGSLQFDEANPLSASVQVDIEADSIDTQEEQRDAHLRSADFLETAQYPKISFDGNSLEQTGDGKFIARGDLTIRGVSKPVTLDIEYAGAARDPWGGERVGFSAQTTISRKDFGLIWNQTLETGGILIGDEVHIDIEIEAVKEAPAEDLVS